MKKKIIIISCSIAALILILLSIILPITISKGKKHKGDNKQIACPELSAEFNIVMWNKIDNAYKYDVYIDDIKVDSTSDTYYETYKLGEFDVSVRALAIIGYRDSEMSNKLHMNISQKELDAPLIALEDNIVKWNPITGATSYDIYVNDEFKETTSEVSYTILGEGDNDYKVYVIAKSSYIIYNTSQKSNEVTYQHRLIELSKPEIYEEGGSIKWNANLDASSYEVYVNDTKVANTNNSYFELKDLPNGLYTITVKAIGDMKKYKDSQMSNSISFYFSNKPTISFDKDTMTLTWDEVSEATSYKVYLSEYTKTNIYTDNKLVADSLNRQYTLSVSKYAFYSVVIEAVIDYDYVINNRDTFVYANFVAVSAPHIVNDNGKITWEYIKNSDGYIVEINEQTINVAIEEYVLPDAVGKYYVRVKAVGDYETYGDSVWSNGIIHIVTKKLDNVKNLTIENDILLFDEVENAVAYEVYLDNALYKKVYTNSCELVDISAGLHDIAVIAIGDDVYLNSDITEAIKYYVLETLQAPIVSDSANSLSWQAVENAVSYGVYKNDQLLLETTELSIDLGQLAIGQYEFYVIAIGNHINYNDSKKSNIIEKTVFDTLDTPIVVFDNEQKTLSIANVTNASLYEIEFINTNDENDINKFEVNATNNEYTIIYVNDLDFIESKAYYITVIAKAENDLLHHNSLPSDIIKLSVTGTRVIVSKADVVFNNEGIVDSNQNKVNMLIENGEFIESAASYNSMNYSHSLKTNEATKITFTTLREFTLEIIYKCKEIGMIGINHIDNTAMYSAVSTISEDIGTIKSASLKPMASDFVEGQYTIGFTCEQEILEIKILPLSEVIESDYFYDSISLTTFKANMLEENDPKNSMAMTHPKWDEVQAKYAEYSQNVQQADTFELVIELTNTFKTYFDSVK